MEVYVKGELLDIKSDTDIDVTFDNIRFGGSVLPDAVSTDTDIPLNRHNRRLLGIDFEFWFGKPQIVLCNIFVGGKRYVGYIIVNSATETTANITIYLSTSFTELADVPLRNLITDDSSTIFKWAEVQSELHSGIFPSYSVEKQSTKGCYGRHPVASHIDIKNAIYDKFGIVVDDSDWTLPTGDNYWNIDDISVVATGKYVTPSNPTQCILAIAESGSNVYNLFGGQHIVNNLYTDEQPLWSGSQWLPVTKQGLITFNRSCKATFVVERLKPTMVYDTYIYINGVAQTDMVDNNYGNSVTTKTTTKTFSAGDTLNISRGDTSGGNILMIKVTYSNYSIGEDDYDQELKYQPVSVDWSDYTSLLPVPDHSVGWSFSFFGLWNNMPEKTVKEYLTTICWMSNMRYIRTDNPTSLKLVSLGNLPSRILERELVSSIHFSSDKVGKTNLIRYKEDSVPSAVIYANGEGLEDEKVIYESAFKTPRSPRDLLMQRMVCVPMYEVDFEEEGVMSENWDVNYEDLEGVIGNLYYDENTYAYLTMPPLLKKMNLDNFYSVVEIEGWTRQPIATDDAFVIDGERFAIVSVDYNEKEDNYRYTAIRGGARPSAVAPGNERVLVGFLLNGDYYIVGEKDSNNDFKLIGK